MTTMMDTGESFIDPQSEVKKLQDLVQKLERQNELLRGRQKTNEPLQNGEVTVDRVTNRANNNYSAQTNTESYKFARSDSIGSLDDVDLIDIEKSLNDNEDSWLYTSPKPPTASQTRISPYKWVRQEFDHPSPEVESAKRSLLHRLDEVARLSRSSSTPAFSSFTSPTKNVSLMSHSTESTPVHSQSQRPMIRKPVATVGSKINTGTFTRPKKSKERPPPIQTENVENHQPSKHPDVQDIETLAKLQEESLRQSISQASPKRGHRAPRQLPSLSALGTSDTDNSGSSPRSSPGRYEGDSLGRRHSQSNSVGSDISSPPDSPYGSQYLNPNTESSNMRRSLPNVSRLAHQSGLHSSDPNLDHHLSTSDEYEGRQYSRLQPQMRPASPNISGLKQPSPVRRGMSPQRTGLPQPARRSIPRPGNTSKPTPRRSGIPSPRPMFYQDDDRRDDSWKEGCF